MSHKSAKEQENIRKLELNEAWSHKSGLMLFLAHRWPSLFPTDLDSPRHLLSILDALIKPVNISQCSIKCYFISQTQIYYSELL